MTQLNNKFTVDITSPYVKDMKNSYWFSRNIMYLHREQIMSGYSSGNMMPDENINRLEAVILLVRALGLELEDPKGYFKDVPASKFGTDYIVTAVKSGILSGFSDGTFRPTQTVTRAEMSMMIARAFQLKEGTESVPAFKDVNENISGYADIRKVVSNGIAQGFEGNIFKPYEKMNRATYAVFLSRAYNPNLKVQ